VPGVRWHLTPGTCNLSHVKNTADVVIIGGGCMGASVAYHLTKRGIRDVIVVEREPLLGMGSTGRNAGGVRHQFSSEANVKLSIESIRLLERFNDEVGSEIDFHQDGYLFLLATQESVTSFETGIQMQRRLGVDVDLLSPSEAQSLAPGLEVDGILAASFCARDGIADPNGVTMGFAKASQSAGAEIYRDTEVTSIQRTAGRITAVETTRGLISTPVVVNAAGPYARRIGEMAGVDIPVHPLRRHIFITEPMAKALGTAAPSSRVMVIDFDTTFYFHREGAGILFGMGDPGQQPGFDTTVSWEFLEQVTRVAVRRLPVLGEAGIAHAWAGLYEMSPDGMPIIGPAREVEGFFMINGFSGHGFQHAPAAGRLLADIIAAQQVPDSDAAPFSFERFGGGASPGEFAVV